MSIVTRFAPSPTGDLHLGHAYAAATAWRLARRDGGRFVVRIEDIDRERCRDVFVDRILDDLAWLGLDWDGPVIRQSSRSAEYAAALGTLDRLAVTYRCVCTRAEIQAEIAAAAAAPQGVAGEAPYPGTCRRRSPDELAGRIREGLPFAVRLDGRCALELAGGLTWTDGAGVAHAVVPGEVGDVVIARKALATSYHLAVVVDDAAEGVTHVTRGDDLTGATPLHRVLYALLGYPPPLWTHHPLCRDASGRRFAKRDRDVTIGALRAAGCTPADILALAERAAGAALPPAS